jgi:hypothetical protein
MRRLPFLAILLVACAGVVLAQGRQAIARFEYQPDGAITVRVLDAEGKKGLEVEWLRLSAIGDQYERGRTIQGSVTATSGNAFSGTLGLPGDSSWNLDVRAKVGDQELRGTYLISSDAFTRGEIPLSRPNTGEVARMSRVIGLGFLAVVLLGVLATLWGVLRSRRAEERADAEAAKW